MRKPAGESLRRQVEGLRFLFYGVGIGLRSEAGDHGLLRDEQRALDQHPVGGKEGIHLILAHAGKALLQVQRPVLYAAGVEKPSDVQAALFHPGAQLRLGGPVLPDVPDIIGRSRPVQPFSGLLAFCRR